MDSRSLPFVKEFLERYRGKKVFFEPLSGNWGDLLIKMGSLEIFKKTGLKLVKRPERADLIIINGGGGMTPLWKHGFRVLEYYSSNFQSKPIVVLPSSWSFDPSNFSVSFGKRAAPIYLYSREPYSFELLKNVKFEGEVYCGLDHDMAFHLEESSFIKKLKSKSRNQHVLVVERGDVESSTGLEHPLPNLIRLARIIFPKPLRKTLPTPVRNFSVKLLWFLERLFFSQKNRKSSKESLFAKESIDYVSKMYPEFAELPIHTADISLQSICSFRCFCLLITQASVVITTRLHVAILSSLLGKPTFLKLGNWHKIIGVYEFSLKKRGNVKII